MSARWTKPDAAWVADLATYYRGEGERVGRDVLLAVIGDFRARAASWRRAAGMNRDAAFGFLGTPGQEHRATEFNGYAMEKDRSARVRDLIADRLEAGDLPPGAFRDDEVTP